MPTTTNLSITYPASSDYVTNGATAMGTIATGIDAFFGQLTAYTPTLTNVTSPPTCTGRYVRMGKLGYVRIAIPASAATVTASLTDVTVTLPSGWTGYLGLNQFIAAFVGSGGNYRHCLSQNFGGGTMIVYKDYNHTQFTAGNSIEAIIQGWLELD